MKLRRNSNSAKDRVFGNPNNLAHALDGEPKFIPHTCEMCLSGVKHMHKKEGDD